MENSFYNREEPLLHLECIYPSAGKTGLIPEQISPDARKEKGGPLLNSIFVEKKPLKN